MDSIRGKSVVVIGGSRGAGRRIVEAAAREGARVLAVARQEGPLGQLAREVPGVDVLALDATQEEAPARVFGDRRPDLLVLGGGVFPPSAPLHELSWRDFSVNWEGDVKIAFQFSKAALSLPLAAGTLVVQLASGAALLGSPMSGGYAGAKRTQMFIASYAQKESDRLGLGLRFVAVAPKMMTDTELAQRAIAGYARRQGISAAEFVQRMEAPATTSTLAAAVLELAARPERSKGGEAYLASGAGLEPVRT